MTWAIVLLLRCRNFEDIKFFLFLGIENFLKISLKSEISKKYEKNLISELVSFDSALIYTYLIKFLIKTKLPLKFDKIFLMVVKKFNIYIYAYKIYIGLDIVSLIPF